MEEEEDKNKKGALPQAMVECGKLIQKYIDDEESGELDFG